MTSRNEMQRTLPGNSMRSPLFKYYIHDSVSSCRFELIGELSEANVTDLDGCWHTARPTLAGRQLILDLRALDRVDELGKQWLAAMAVEGAQFVPETYLRGAIASDTPLVKPSKLPERLTFWGRIMAWLRGSPVPIK